MAFDWIKSPSGDWWLFDRPRGAPRHPVASISGGARIGFTASIHSGAKAGVRERGASIPALKRKIQGYLA